MKPSHKCQPVVFTHSVGHRSERRARVLVAPAPALLALRIADCLREAGVCPNPVLMPYTHVRSQHLQEFDVSFVCVRALPDLRADASTVSRIVAVGPMADVHWMHQAQERGVADCWPTEADLADAAPAIVRRIMLGGYILRQSEQATIEQDGEIAKLRARVRKLSADATTDPLTGLANRRQLETRCREFWSDACRSKANVSCIAIDLDHFKPINDALGHQRGDEILRVVGEVLRRETRASDFCVRSGGDEFEVLMPRTPLETAQLVGARIAASFAGHRTVVQASRDIAQHLGRTTAGVWCTLSFGVSSTTLHDQRSFETLLERADDDLRRSKQRSRCRARVPRRVGFGDGAEPIRTRKSA